MADLSETDKILNDKFADFFTNLCLKHGGDGYEKGNILSFLWMVYRIHRMAKKCGLTSVMQLKLGKDL